MSTFSGTARFGYYRGRVALAGILRSMGVGRGDEVALQAFTCVAVPEGIQATGARPLWVDIEAGSVNMSPADLGRRITSKTRAIVVQHTFGIPADMDAILALARERDVPVIEDCCHTLASTYSDRYVGTLGSAAFYSFEWGKPLVAGVGGAAVPNDPKLVQPLSDDWSTMAAPPRMRSAQLFLQYHAYSSLYRPGTYWRVRSAFRALSSWGVVEGSYTHDSQRVAEDFGWKMDDGTRKRLQRRLSEADEIFAAMRLTGELYQMAFSAGEVDLPNVPPRAHAVYARFPLLVDNKEALLSRAENEGLEIAGWYDTPVHPLGASGSAAVGYEWGQCPVAEETATRIVSLPTHSRVSISDVARTVQLVRSTQNV